MHCMSWTIIMLYMLLFYVILAFVNLMIQDAVDPDHEHVGHHVWIHGVTWPVRVIQDVLVIWRTRGIKCDSHS